MKYEIGNHDQRLNTDSMVEALVHYNIFREQGTCCYVLNKTENNVLLNHGFNPLWNNTPTEADTREIERAETLLSAYVEAMK